MKLYLLAIVLMGCYDAETRFSSYDLTLPNGEYARAIWCVESPDLCYYEAGQRCPLGYNIRNLAPTQEYSKADLNVQVNEHNTRWSLIVQCK